MNKVLYDEIISNLNNIISAQEYSKVNGIVKEYLSNNRTTSGFKTVYRALYDACLNNVKLYSLKGWAIVEFNKLYKEINYDLIKKDSFELESVILMGDSRFDKVKLNEPEKREQVEVSIPVVEPIKSTEESSVIPLEEIEVKPIINEAENVIVNNVSLSNQPTNDDVIEMKDLAINADGTLASNLELESLLAAIKDKRDFVDVDMTVSAEDIYIPRGIRTKDAKSRIARVSKDTFFDIASNIKYIKEKKLGVKEKIKLLSKDEIESVKRFLKISDTFNLFEEKINNIFAVRQERLRLKEQGPIGYADSSFDNMRRL